MTHINPVSHERLIDCTERRIFERVGDFISTRVEGHRAKRRSARLRSVLERADILRDPDDGDASLVIVNDVTDCESPGEPVEGTVFRLDLKHQQGSCVKLHRGAEGSHINFSPDTIDPSTLSLLESMVNKGLHVSSR